MGDIKLFHIGSDGVNEIAGQSVAVEKSLQTLIERNLEKLLGIRFVASEHSTGKVHGGRIDTLGIDENGFPVIVEYKRSLNESVINQGLFYIDWLMDHQGDYHVLVQKSLGAAVAETINWSNPRLLCIAGDYTRYDELMVKQIGRTIELIRYRMYGDDLLMLELVNAVFAPLNRGDNGRTSATSKGAAQTVSDSLERASPQVKALFEGFEAYVTALGDDVQKNVLQVYIAFRRIKNFACVQFTRSEMIITLKVNPDAVTLEEGFSRDVRNIGHNAPGDLEVRIDTPDDLERAKSLILRSYESS